MGCREGMAQVRRQRVIDAIVVGVVVAVAVVVVVEGLEFTDIVQITAGLVLSAEVRKRHCPR